MTRRQAYKLVRRAARGTRPPTRQQVAHVMVVVCRDYRSGRPAADRVLREVFPQSSRDVLGEFVRRFLADCAILFRVAAEAMGRFAAEVKQAGHAVGELARAMRRAMDHAGIPAS